MITNEKPFFNTLGARIAARRKAQGLSQQALADELGVAQQTLVHHEVGRAYMPVSWLPVLAGVFPVAVDDLLGDKNGTARRGPTPKLRQQIERLNCLPKAKPKVVMEMLDGVLSQTTRQGANARRRIFARTVNGTQRRHEVIHGQR